MKISYKHTTILLSVLVITLTSVVAALAGNVDSPSRPTDAASQMYTLEQLYQRLATGAPATKMVTFTEPSSGPGSTMHTLDDIMDAAPAVSATGAISTGVQAEKTFWGLTAGEWGLQTGKLYGGCHCAGGTLNGTRWCDNGDGTVTDLLGDSSNNNVGRCLVWLKDADCSYPLGGVNKVGPVAWDEAGVWSSAVNNGVCGLTDGSTAFEWRLPTRAELDGITHGTDGVSSDTMRAFTHIYPAHYWTLNVSNIEYDRAWTVHMGDIYLAEYSRSGSLLVWPVRAGR